MLWNVKGSNKTCYHTRFTTLAQYVIGKNRIIEAMYQAAIDIISDPINLWAIPLKAWDILILDNERVLHGRTGFKGSREVIRHLYA
ncbi:TauD/TfdA family dioxygenase [Zooshikella sp. RANM57]|uniref:TauD/TfdA family dioxygenase n=1 Tax=Zooshikella sp. RANM57 TaxID=3425863 RepID=UPI003D6FAAC5